MILEEARNKGAAPPTFEDELDIPLVLEMEVDSSVKLRGSPAWIYAFVSSDFPFL